MKLCHARRVAQASRTAHTGGVFALTFQRFGTPHLTALLITAVIAALMIWHRRRWMEVALAVALLMAWPISVLSHVLGGDLNLQNGLPLHLCDVAAFSGVIAILKRRPLACEMVYFFGLAGTLQGLITPALQAEFPSPRFFSFFLTHGAIVIAALHVVCGMGITPRPGALWRMLVCILTYAGSVAVIDGLLGVNYGFVCEKPPTASLMDQLGPWPWYVFAMVGLATVFFAILDLPFVVRRKR